MDILSALLSIAIAIFIVVLIVSAIFMAVWNNILIKKFPSSNIQTLKYWDAVGLVVAISLVCGGSVIVLGSSKNGMSM